MIVSAPVAAVVSTGPQAFLFADLCGYTEFTCCHGDERAAELAVAFQARAGELADAEGCQVIKALGDAVMVRAQDCPPAIRLAVRMLALSAREGFPPIRAGVDFGPAVECGGDWYGSTVNTASRLADSAAPGELVVSSRAEAMAGPSIVARTWRHDRVRVKGLPELAVTALAIL
jgi:adenylate cyclase